jgi:hypothetical protein
MSVPSHYLRVCSPGSLKGFPLTGSIPVQFCRSPDSPNHNIHASTNTEIDSIDLFYHRQLAKFPPNV